MPISRNLEAVENSCEGDQREENRGAGCHEAALGLAEATIRYLGAVAVAQYSQALYTGEIEADPTLNRSLRNLRRLLPGQWLGWTARALEAVPNGPVEGLAIWYKCKLTGDVTVAYEELRRVMVESLGYTGEYGPQEMVSPRLLLEMVDQYRIRRSRAAAGAIGMPEEARLAGALPDGLRAVVGSAPFLGEYVLYAPQERKLLMGMEATRPMPPLVAPEESEATLLLYPPGEMPDYTKRPSLQAERKPLFPLDPLLVYINCPQCGQFRVAALSEVEEGKPLYLGLDPDCGHSIRTIDDRR